MILHASIDSKLCWMAHINHVKKLKMKVIGCINNNNSLSLRSCKFQDIAPRNLILDPFGQLWLIDWAYAGV
jgi:thiamine kinase-like enzyme